MRRINRVMRPWPYANLILSTCLLGFLIVTVSCGDFQDPAPASSAGVILISGFPETEHKSPSDIQETQPSSAEQNGQSAPSTIPPSSSSDTSGTVPPTDTSRNVRSVTLSWDPSP